MPRRRIIIFCEGVTEEHYLKWLAASLRGLLVSVEPIGSVGVPTTVVDRAIERRSELKRSAGRAGASSFDAQFSVWAMFDKDDHEVAEALDRAQVNAIGVAYSNPCFELWGVIHFEDHHAPDNRHEVQSRLRELMPGYDHERNPYFVLEALTDDRRYAACRRATDLRDSRANEGAPLGNPCTTVDKLILQILSSVVQSQPIDDQIAELEAKIAAIQATEAFQQGDRVAHATNSELHRRLKAIKQRPV